MPCTNKVKPLLVAASISEIAKTIDVSFPYAAAIRTGRRRPNPGHWQTLSALIGSLRRGG
jgi:hypothetical protein